MSGPHLACQECGCLLVSLQAASLSARHREALLRLTKSATWKARAADHVVLSGSWCGWGSCPGVEAHGMHRVLRAGGYVGTTRSRPSRKNSNSSAAVVPDRGWPVSSATVGHLAPPPPSTRRPGRRAGSLGTLCASSAARRPRATDSSRRNASTTPRAFPILMMGMVSGDNRVGGEVRMLSLPVIA